MALQRIAITGASGLIGSALAGKLKSEGYTVQRLVRRATVSSEEIFWSPLEGKVDLDSVKEGRDTMFKVDHVLRNETHFLFAETIQDAEIIEEVVEEEHS